MLFYGDKGQSLYAWAKETGIAYTTLKNRIDSGWSAKEALETPVNRQVNLICYKGKKQSAYAWARETGINYQTLVSRINLGWPAEEALSKAATKKNKKRSR